MWGLNTPARRNVVHELVQSTRSTIVCLQLQETKLAAIDRRIVTETLGTKFANSFCYLPAVGVRGGILQAVLDDHFDLKKMGTAWFITGVYGSQEDDMINFLQELRSLLPTVSRREWLILGDFNLIYQAAHKSNQNLNRRLMGSFISALNHLDLKEINLSGRRFTWCNERENSTYTRIDRMFCTTSWDLLFPSAFLQALPTLASDHAPLLLHGEMERQHFKGFRFENHWTKLDGFLQVVHEAWNRPVSSQNAIKRLHIKLSRTAKALKKLVKLKVGNTKLQLAIVKEVIFQLNKAQEHRALSQQEFLLRRRLKARCLGLATIANGRI